MNDKKKQLCKYGAECYRKNPIHLQEFYHPSQEKYGFKKLKSSRSDLSLNRKPFKERLKVNEPFNIFLNKIKGVPDTKHDWQTLVFPDLLNFELGTIVESLQINFMLDLSLIMEFYQHFGLIDTPVLFVSQDIEGDPKIYKNITYRRIKSPIPYGTHHTKMMIFLYTDGLRVVVHTSNLIEDDLFEKTQAFWVSPKFPLKGEAACGFSDSVTNFKGDLVEYLKHYKLKELDRWCDIIDQYNFSACNAFFISSVPGYHKGDEKMKYGHMKCRRVLSGPSLPDLYARKSNLIIQCSSIGSLGKDSKSWLEGQFLTSLTGGSNCRQTKTSVIYPTHEDVRNSSQSYAGGSCLPYSLKTHNKQLWLENFLNCWRSDQRRRTKSMPHVKFYAHVFSDQDDNAQTNYQNSANSEGQHSKNSDRSLPNSGHTSELNSNNSPSVEKIPEKSYKTFASMVFLGSHNLSKAAWGELQKDGTQLFIRSFEAGVLLLPQNVINSEKFEIEKSDKKPSILRLPFDLPLTPYGAQSEPWCSDRPIRRDM